MQPHLKHLGLTQLEKALPALYETARQEQWTYESFMNRALAAGIEGRDRRAAERRMTAARLPTLMTRHTTSLSWSPPAMSMARSCSPPIPALLPGEVC